MNNQHKTLVMALGNPLRGDDGVGVAVLSQLQREKPHCLLDGIDFVDGGTGGLELCLLMQGYERAIIIDAAEMGASAGTCIRITSDQLLSKSGDLGMRGTLHYAGLAEALALGEALRILPTHLVIFGVQPATLDWSVGISHTVQAAIPSICRMICKELEHDDIQNSDH